ncbi:granzyme A-like [Rhynochetos jubatus]
MKSRLLALLLSLIAVTLPPSYDCTDIIRGHDVCPHFWPSMASIQKQRSTLFSVSEVTVVLGAHQASTAEREQQEFKVMHCFPHPQFHKHSMVNDIMLLKLDRVAELNKYVQLLPLPDSFEDIKPGTECQVAGWGYTSETKQKPSKYLREATLEIVGRESCARKYENNPGITSDMLCAGGKSNTCQRDSSGPLICGGRYSGIVSFGKGCGRRGMPGVYTRLTEKYIKWIKETIALHKDP